MKPRGCRAHEIFSKVTFVAARWNAFPLVCGMSLYCLYIHALLQYAAETRVRLASRASVIDIPWVAFLDTAANPSPRWCKALQNWKI